MHHARDGRSAVHASQARLRAERARAGTMGPRCNARRTSRRTHGRRDGGAADRRADGRRQDHGRDLPAGAAATGGSLRTHRTRGAPRPAAHRVTDRRQHRTLPRDGVAHAHRRPRARGAADARGAVPGTVALRRPRARDRRPRLPPHRGRDALRPRLVHRAGASNRLDASCDSADCGEDAHTTAAGGRRGRFRQRGRVRTALGTVPVHQHRSHRVPLACR